MRPTLHCFEFGLQLADSTHQSLHDGKVSGLRDCGLSRRARLRSSGSHGGEEGGKRVAMTEAIVQGQETELTKER